jgi:hypothetical protein
MDDGQRHVAESAPAMLRLLRDWARLQPVAWSAGLAELIERRNQLLEPLDDVIVDGHHG